MAHTRPLVTWQDQIHDLMLFLARTERTATPVSFLLGAGTSLSSGGATFAEIKKAFREATEGRFPTELPLEDYMDKVTYDEKREILAQLFEGFQPAVGYMCLAAMGRTRPVRVVNLNWDLGVETACAELGVVCRSFDIDEVAAASAAAGREAPGVVVVHLHGRIDGRIRYARMETLKFEDDQKELLHDRFFAHLTIVVGASLSADTDLAELIASAPYPKDAPPLWVLSREDPSEGIAVNVDRWLDARTSRHNHPIDPNIDFDEVLLLLREGQLEMSLESRYESNGTRYAPAMKNLVPPNQGLLRQAWGARCLVIVGETTLGKTTLAQVYAHWLALTLMPDAEVAIATGARECRELIAEAGDGVPRVIVLNDPFGAEESEPNLEFDTALGELMEDLSVRAIITSRFSRWPADDSWDERAGFARLSGTPEDWFDRRSLQRHLDRTLPAGSDKRDRLSEEIQRGSLNTPARVNNAIEGFFGGDEDPGAVEDKRAFVIQHLRSADPTLGILLVLVRLQECSDELIGRDEIFALQRGTNENLEQSGSAQAMLQSYRVGGSTHARLRHSTDREAVDRAMRDLVEGLDKLLHDLGPGAYWAREALKVWRSFGSGAEERVLAKSDELLRLSWASSAVARLVEEGDEEAKERTLELIRGAEDFWVLSEVTYEATRFWSSFDKDKKFTAAYLAELAKQPLGFFALLEPLLFWRERQAHPLWREVDIGMERLGDGGAADADDMVGLAFDSLLWRPPPIDAGALHRYFEILFDFAGGTDDPVHGALAFARVYHHDSLDQLPPDLSRRLEEMTVRTAAQAEAASSLFRFHFLHECRNRALLPRRDYDETLRRFLSHDPRPAPAELDQHPAKRLLVDMARFPEQRGWALHAALNYGVVHGDLGDDFLAELVREPLPDRDDGTISAVLACRVPEVLWKPLRAYFAKPENRELLLDRMADGFEVDGTAVRRPRFQYARRVQAIFDDLDIDWPSLRNRGLPDRDHPRLMRELRSVAQRLGTAEVPMRIATEWVVRRSDYGDLRTLSASLPPRGAPESALQQALEVAARGRMTEEGRLL
jgi:hypothetical protein